MAAQLRAALAAELALLPPALGGVSSAGPLLALASGVFSDGDYARCGPVRAGGPALRLAAAAAARCGLPPARAGFVRLPPLLAS
jgi:hypothetical protein